MDKVVLHNGPEDGKLLNNIDWSQSASVVISVSTKTKSGKDKVTNYTYVNTNTKDTSGYVVFRLQSK